MDLFKEDMHNKAFANGHICRDAVFKNEMKKLMPFYNIHEVNKQEGETPIQGNDKVSDAFLEYYLKVDPTHLSTSGSALLIPILKKYFTLIRQERLLNLFEQFYDATVCDEYAYVYYPLICLATLLYMDPTKYFSYCDGDQDNNMYLEEFEEYKEKVDLMFSQINIDPSKIFVSKLVAKRKDCTPFPGTVTTDLTPRNLRKKYAETLTNSNALPVINPPLSSVSNLLRREVILSALTCAEPGKINSYEDFRYTDPSDTDIWEYLEINIVIPLLKDRLNVNEAVFWSKYYKIPISELPNNIQNM